MTFETEVLADTPWMWWDTRLASGSVQPDGAPGNVITGTVIGSPTQDADGLHFDGVADGIECDVASNPTIPFDEFSMEFVVQPVNATGYFYFGGFQAAVGNDYLALEATGSTVDAFWFGTAGESLTGAAGGLAAALQHWVFEFDGTDYTIYKNGAVYATVADSQPPVFGASQLFRFMYDDLGSFSDALGRHAIFYNDHALGAARVAIHATAALTDDPFPGPAVPAVISGLSDAQIIELQYGGQRQDRFTFPLLNPDRSPLGASLDAHADSAPSIQVQTQRTSFRTCSGLIVDDPPPDLDLSRVRVQPTLTLANGSQYPLGVLMFGLDARNIHATGEQWTPELFDETFLLDQDLADTWSLGAGGSVLGLFVALADEILGPLGIPADYEIDDVAAVNPIVFKVGTSRNAALVALSALLGALPPFFDNRGTYRLKPAPAGLASDHSYEIGTRIFDASTVVSSSLYKAPNRYIVVGDDVGGTPVRGVFDLPDAAGNSFASTGQRVTAPVHTVSGVKSVELATQIAYVDALTDQTTYGTAVFAAAADPRHDIFDTVTLLGVQYLETGWTLACASGGDHSHGLSRLWA